MTDSHSELPPRNDIDTPIQVPGDSADSLAQHYLAQPPTTADRTPLQQTPGQSMRFDAVRAAYKELSKSDLPTEAIPRVTTFSQAAAQSLRESYRQYKQEYKPVLTEARKAKPSRALGRMVSRFFKK